MVALRVGDIVAIPTLNGEQHALVLFLSRHFKKVMLLGVVEAADHRFGSIDEVASAVSLLIYTSRESVDAGRWRVVGHTPVPGSAEFSERIVANTVWRQDLKLRPAPKTEARGIPTMRIAGEGAVEKMLGQFRGEGAVSPVAAQILSESEETLRRIRSTRGLGSCT